MPTKIEWTDETWNPVTGCTPVSEGCAHCYAERLSNRFGRDFRKVTLHPDRLEVPLHWRKPQRVFVCSMGDLFHPEVSDAFILAVWAVMEAVPHHTYQILTKRPQRMHDLFGGAPTMTPILAQPPYERSPIPGRPGYYADTKGVIWSGRRGVMKILSPDIGEQGHQRVHLFDGSGSLRGERHLVHRLVLSTFDRPGSPDEQVCHRDGNPTNNAISNLCWGSQEENWQDSKRHGTHRRYQKLMALDVARLRMMALQGEPAERLGPRFDISPTQARNIIRGDQWGLRVLPSVWLGVSVENQAMADERIPLLLDTPAAVRFVSAEPLLGPLDLTSGHKLYSHYDRSSLLDAAKDWCWLDQPNGLDWVIVGGECGGPPERRLVERCGCCECCRESCPVCGGTNWKPKPEAYGWLCNIRDQCQAAGVPFFFKQWGPRAGQGTLVDGREHKEMP